MSSSTHCSPSTACSNRRSLPTSNTMSATVPEIYVTPTDSDRSKIPGMAARRDSTNSNLSCSMPNLAGDDLDEANGVESKDLSVYCSPKPSRRNGGKRHHHSHNGGNYPFLKGIGKSHRERLESTDSNESDCSASHQSTCATSDYTHMTSLDMINILSMRDQYHSGQTLGSNMDLSEYGTLRRTHSNPENCLLTEEESKQAMENSDTSLRDSKSCTNLENQMAQPTVVHGNQLLPGEVVPRPTRLVQHAADNINTSLLHAENKSLAVSEENLVSRVNRWLGDVETNEGQSKVEKSTTVKS